MNRATLIVLVVAAVVLGAAAAYLWLPRRIVVDTKYDPNLKV